MNLKAMLTATFVLLFFSMSVQAQTTSERLDKLERMIEELQATLLEARAEMNKMKNSKKDKDKEVVVETKGGLKVKQGGNEFKFGGRLQYDYDTFDDVFTNNLESDGESQSESEWRRTRLFVSGKVQNDWHYKFTLNIDDGEESADVNTAYIQYTGFDPFAITLGKFKEPFSLERMTSSKWLSTIERNMLLEFLAGNLGAGQPDTAGVQISGYHKNANHLNWALGVFDDGSEDSDGEDNYGITGRVTLTPHFGDKHFLHLGAAYSVREIEDQVRYRSRLGVHTAGRLTFADAYVDDVDQFGLEMAYVRGPFSLQSEYINVSADGDLDPDADVLEGVLDSDGDLIRSNRQAGACYTDTNNSGGLEPNLGDTPASCSDIDFDGYYVQATYTLTGETRGYKTQGAYFDKLKPSSPFGAWEVVARYEDAEVDNDNIGNGGLLANRGDTYDAEKWLIGLNWYVNNNVRFMLNYIDAEVDEALAQGDGDDDDGDAVSFRAQYVW